MHVCHIFNIQAEVWIHFRLVSKCIVWYKSTVISQQDHDSFMSFNRVSDISGVAIFFFTYETTDSVKYGCVRYSDVPHATSCDVHELNCIKMVILDLPCVSLLASKYSNTVPYIWSVEQDVAKWKSSDPPIICVDRNLTPFWVFQEAGYSAIS